MSGLPPGWARVRVRDLGGTVGGKTPSMAVPAFWTPAEIPWASPKDMKHFELTATQDKISRCATVQAGMTVLPVGTVLVVTRSGILSHTLPIALTRLQTAINQDIKAVLPSPHIYGRYLAYALRSQQQEILQSCTKEGTTVASVSTELFEALPLPFAPLNEQKRIADKLDALLAQVDTCRERLDRVPGILKRFRQSVLAAATSGRLTEDWNGAFPRGCLKDIVAEPLRNGKSVRDGDGIRVLRLSALKVGGVELAVSKPGDWTGIKTDRFLVRSGDFLVARGNGTLDLVGRGGLVGIPQEPVAFPDTMIRIRAEPTRVLPEFLRLVWDTEGVRDQIEGTARTSAGIWKISQPDIERIMFPLPPVHVQKEIVRRVEILFAYADELEARVASARAQVERLTPALLAKAFRGELVPQDPNDESAEVLLERLRAENAGQEKKRGVRKA